MKKASGLTAFVIERGMPGFRTGKKIHKMGLRASDTTELIFEDVTVGDEQRLGEIDNGFFDTLKVLGQGAHRHRRLVGGHRARGARGLHSIRKGKGAVR